MVSQKYRNPGRNYVWHIDGHEKPKPFCFSVYGCIDEFSRKLIWLDITPSNKVREIIWKYYLKTEKRLKVVPKRMKLDNGTGHSLIEPMHIYLPSLNDNTGDALHSSSIMSSSVNQRINSHCSKFVVGRPGWWKSFFQDIVNFGNTWSKWTRFIGLYQVLVYEYSTTRT